MSKIKKHLRRSTFVRSARELVVNLSSFSDSPFKSTIKSMAIANISCVIDIGANVGQFGLDMRRYGFKGQIISFEPVKDTYEVLSRTIKKDISWKSFNLGLGAKESEQTINVSGNDGLSSSLLSMGKVHLNNFPESATVSTQKIAVSTIDKQLSNLGIDPRRTLIKLDVQGYESEVLKGAAKSLSKIPLCFLEVSIVPLYEGEITLLPILNLLSESGHEVIDIFRGIKAKNGQLLQVDILTRQVSSKSD